MSQKHYERLMDIIQHSARNPELDFVMKTKKGEETLPAKQIQSFLRGQMHDFIKSSTGNRNDKTAKAIQAFTGSTDLAKIETNIWNAFQETPNYDMGWQSAFRTVPLSPGQLYWSIGNVTSGISMEVIAEGEKVKYGSIAGTVAKVEIELYGTGLSLTWKTIEGRDLARFYSDMQDFRAVRMKGYADAHYGLLAAASLSYPIAWQGVTADTDLVRDTKTINLGADTIGTNTKDLGFGDTANAKYILYVSPLLKARTLAVLKSTSSLTVQSGNQAVILTTNIEVIYTYNAAIPANKGVMVLPGNKIQNAIYMKDKSFSRQDPDTLNMLKSSFDAFGGAVGETKQTCEISFA